MSMYTPGLYSVGIFSPRTFISLFLVISFTVTDNSHTHFIITRIINTTHSEVRHNLIHLIQGKLIF